MRLDACRRRIFDGAAVVSSYRSATHQCTRPAWHTYHCMVPMLAPPTTWTMDVHCLGTDIGMWLVSVPLNHIEKATNHIYARYPKPHARRVPAERNRV